MDDDHRPALLVATMSSVFKTLTEVLGVPRDSFGLAGFMYVASFEVSDR
jgi:hypothetical protein